MKIVLIAIGLLLTSFASFAEDITENQLQNYIKALPAVVDWSEEQPSLQSLDLGNMLGGSEASTASSATSALSMIKDNDLYKQFANLTAQYGFTPEQLVSVGSQVSMAYVENIKAGLSPENQQRVDQVMGGLQSLGGSKDKSATSLMGGLSNSTAATNMPEVSDNNIALVKEYMPQLKKLFATIQ